jgi:sigma-B regulation protein RsbU (phosphoserine phosphatase)
MRRLADPSQGLVLAPTTRKRPALAVLIDHIDHFSGGYESVLRANFESACEELDFDLFVVVGGALAPSDASGPTTDVVYQLLSERAVDGIVLMSAGLAGFSGLAGIQGLCRSYGDVPLCSVGLEVPGVPSIVLGQRAGMREVVEHVIVHHGRRRIAYLSGPATNPDAALRLAVCRETMAEHGLELDDALVAFGGFNYVTGTQSMHELLDRGSDFDAVIAANDGMAIGAASVLSGRGLRVPADVVLTGFDDLAMARHSEPPLTTVRQPLERMARLAVSLVVQQIRGLTVPLVSEIAAELVVRGSCGCEGFGATLRVSAPPAAREPAPTLRGEYEAILARVGTSLRDHSSPTIRRLLDASLSEAEGQAGAVQVALEQCVAQIGTKRELFHTLEQVLGALWQAIQTIAPQLSDAFGSGKEQILRAQNRAQAQHIFDQEVVYLTLLNSGQRLSTVLDLPSLHTALCEVLGEMGVTNASISLYSDESRRALEPFLSVRAGELLKYPGAAFAADQLLPAGLETAKRRTMLVLPLSAETQHWGVAIIEFARSMNAHELLRDQLSATLTTLALHRQIIQKTTLHERSVQERLATGERMNALSVLAGGVAHDLNNALGPLVALPNLIRQELTHALVIEPDSEIVTDLQQIESAALRATQVIKDLLTLGRQGHTALSPIDLNQTISGCVAETRVRAPARGIPTTRVQFRSSREPLCVLGASQQIARAISNLIQNALEATPGGDPVLVSGDVVLLKEAFYGYEKVEPGEYVRLTFSDTGQGIAEAELPHIFEPFFSRKRLGERSGSGLGLAIVHGVVKEHNGFVHVQSELGLGTTFTLFLPTTRELLPETEWPEVAPRRGAKILVVDDEALQLRTVRRLLTRLGYEITTLSSGERAIDLYRQLNAAAPRKHEPPFDLLIIDVHLNQKLDGLQVLEQLRQVFPDQRCLVVSGDALAEGAGMNGARLPWLAKPFTADALVREVEAALVKREPSARPERACASEPVLAG